MVCTRTETSADLETQEIVFVVVYCPVNTQTCTPCVLYWNKRRAFSAESRRRATQACSKPWEAAAAGRRARLTRSHHAATARARARHAEEDAWGRPGPARVRRWTRLRCRAFLVAFSVRVVQSPMLSRYARCARQRLLSEVPLRSRKARRKIARPIARADQARRSLHACCHKKEKSQWQ